MRTKRSVADATIDPMIALPAASLPAGREWIYEARVQGQRALIYKDGPNVSIRARGEPELEAKYPEVTSAASIIREERAVLDGVVVCEAGVAPRFYAMDIVRFDDRDLRAVPLSERREKLKAIIANSGLRPIQVFDSSMVEAVRTAQEIGLSGLVAKRVDSAYHSGASHGEWLELRFRRAELFVIGGYVPAGSESVDALLVGTLIMGRLRYSARVHEGVVGRVRMRLRQALEPLKTDRCPFVDAPADIGDAVWVHPDANVLVGYFDRVEKWRVSAPRLMYFAEESGD